ncbi:MAG TPA: HAMP domain-containing sensor histidine kinase [Polyangiaceae bacterium]|nr:HAMP domain-containing sensor histidine kinase [Polyangiaceae bacterium]
MTFPHRFGLARRQPRLRRQLFAWLSLTILVTGMSVWGVFHLARVGSSNLPVDVERLEAFVSARFVDVWDDAARRQALAVSLAETLNAGLSVEDMDGHTLSQVRGGCVRPDRSLVVRNGARSLGTVRACFEGHGAGHFVGFLAFGTAGLVLWLAAAVLARKLTRPLSSLIAVTREIGSGKLKSRVRLRRGGRGELGVLADAINDMAERIERQLSEQRELLAAVSHEVRSPLARMRVSTELLRGNPKDTRALTAIESEVAEIDTLVGKLLASSRLDFGSLARASLVGQKLAATALTRRQLPLSLLEDCSDEAKVSCDPTLVARALDNLLDNAEEHGGGVTRLVVRRARPEEHAQSEHALVFEVWDNGAGFDADALKRAFEAFYRAPKPSAESRASLGLGLSLVQRIAAAHGGRAWAENQASGGSRVNFSVG